MTAPSPAGEMRVCFAETKSSPMTMSAPGERPITTGPLTGTVMPISALGPWTTLTIQVPAPFLRWPATRPIPALTAANRNR